ncbi:hypothetical protein GDO78_005548 [Eleutherodactylus coqui]|uniref:Carbonic anhydrase n=1 Tax=Eleutherodactylus coqui TaxID=57060 RepID=A0A8J6FKD3_ELECQ|nr:hypothetical protein GDO78_005548 [Eleutherodactylus coqui]
MKLRGYCAGAVYEGGLENRGVSLVLSLKLAQMYRLLFSILVLPVIQAASEGHSWTYTGEEGEKNWATRYSFCGGVYQSPLDFHGNFLQYDSTLKRIRLYGYNASHTDNFIISNTGHTVSVSLPPSLYMEIPPFRYIASQLHFHWGRPAGHKGSEHCIGGKRFPAEMHIVFYNSKYANIGIAMEAADGLAVLGILIEIGFFNPAYNNIISQLAHIKYKGQKFQIPRFDVQYLLPERPDKYYRYEGSLTTPPCNPSVLWSVFQNPVYISEEQVVYRTVNLGSPCIQLISHSYRLKTFKCFIFLMSG